MSVFHLDVVCLGCVFRNILEKYRSCFETVQLFQITAIVSLTYEAEEFSSHVIRKLGQLDSDVEEAIEIRRLDA